MTQHNLSAWLSHLAALTPLEELSDEHLLRRFSCERDERAFSVLLRRHGPMVLGVCRRVLGDGDTAEDAFQATFLVLVQRSSQVDRDNLGPWLYGIARRIALKARVTAMRRRKHERQVASTKTAVVDPTEPADDVRAVLDEEIAHLPQKLRTVVIACDLQGLSRRAAAARLGCPESTLSSRLSSARNQLAQRLSARGVTLSLAGIVAMVPDALADRCAATAFAALAGTEQSIPHAVLTLSKEVVSTMCRTKKLAICAMVCVALATGVTMLSAPAGEQQPHVVQRSDDAASRRSGARDRFQFIAFDGFGGQLGLKWNVIRPDRSHASLKKHPGMLTIRTQRGSLHGNTPPRLLAKNLYLIDNPFARDGDFTVTTALVNFAPAAQYQQAGLLLYNDDDNYMKWTYEANDAFLKDFVSPSDGTTKGPDWGVDTSPSYGHSRLEPNDRKERPVVSALPNRIEQYDQALRIPLRTQARLTLGYRPFFVLVAERDGTPTHHIASETRQKLACVWLRVSKRGNLYDFFTSLDGKRFIKQGSTEWGRGGPKKIGLIAQNGRDSDAPDIEAQFDFFALQAR
jgi:RNA polymerase sigma factor (sigma-70 family)